MERLGKKTFSSFNYFGSNNRFVPLKGGSETEKCPPLGVMKGYNETSNDLHSEESSDLLNLPCPSGRTRHAFDIENGPFVTFVNSL